MTYSITELALPDGPLYVSEQNDLFVSKLGGRPVPFEYAKCRCWPSVVGSDVLPQAAELKCESCGAQLYLITQVDCPWPGDGDKFDRFMYVFGCNTRICTESQGAKCWRAFILQMPSSQRNKGKESVPSSPFAQKGLWDTIMSDVKEGMGGLQIEDEEAEQLLGIYDESYPVGFPATRLHIVEEMIQEKASKAPMGELDATQIPVPFRAVQADESWAGEVYESSRPAGFDKTFEAFQRRIASYPRQCLRFSAGSTPLLFHREQNQIPSGCCRLCGQKRQFELQLMPAILSILPTCEEKHLKHIPDAKRRSHPIFGDGMEWGIVLVYSCGTCSKANQPVLVEAFVHAQIEQ